MAARTLTSDAAMFVCGPVRLRRSCGPRLGRPARAAAGGLPHRSPDACRAPRPRPIASPVPSRLLVRCAAPSGKLL